MPWNGFSVVSTFAGAGGSSTGYRMAGFRVLLANEFVPIAQESYRANAATGTIVDGRDVKTVKGSEILEACGLAVGELDVFDGSPPCQAFSTAGKREKGWGEEKVYEHGAAQRNEELFFDYIRLRDEMMPRTFVAENVSGLVKGAAKGFFLEIFKRLKVGYRVVCPLLDAQWLGVPQARQRVVFIGVREDLGFDPPTIKPLPWRYSVREALPWLDRVVHDAGGQPQYSGGDVTDRPAPTVMAGRNSFTAIVHDTGRPNQKPRNILDQPAPTIMATPKDNSHFKVVQNSNAAHSRKGEERSLDDPAPTLLARRSNVELANVAEPETDISRFEIGKEYDKLAPGQQSERYFSLVRADPDAPSPTITALGGSTSTASVVHPTEKRKFTILEVKRLSGFPDDYVLKGTYGQQWERLGNSVPPVMMRHVAEALRDQVLIPARAAGRIAAPSPRSPARSTTARSRKGAARRPAGSAPRRPSK